MLSAPGPATAVVRDSARAREVIAYKWRARHATPQSRHGCADGLTVSCRRGVRARRLQAIVSAAPVHELRVQLGGRREKVVPGIARCIATSDHVAADRLPAQIRGDRGVAYPHAVTE